MKILQGRVNGGDDGVHLGGVAGAEDGEHPEEGIEAGQPFPLGAQAVLDVVHGAADVFSPVVALPVVDGQHYLGEFGAHAQEGGAPHPEHRAGTADGHGSRHAGDVARTHGAGQSRTHRLEGADGAVLGGFPFKYLAQGGFHGLPESPNLNASGAEGQQQAHAHNADDGGHAPDKIVHGSVDPCDPFNHNLSSFCCFVQQIVV